MRSIRAFVGACACFAAGWLSPLHARADATPAHAPSREVPDDTPGLHDFDFLFGDWTVRHRRLDARTREWQAFDGTSSTRPIMGGAGNLEDNVLDAVTGRYRASAVRAFDANTGLWAIWWVDGRTPHGALDPPVKGRFENGIGRFYADYDQDGKPMKLRFVWTRADARHAHWEQATSADGGATWDTNWTMAFTRAGASKAP